MKPLFAFVGKSNNMILLPRYSLHIVDFDFVSRYIVLCARYFSAFAGFLNPKVKVSQSCFSNTTLDTLAISHREFFLFLSHLSHHSGQQFFGFSSPRGSASLFLQPICYRISALLTVTAPDEIRSTLNSLRSSQPALREGKPPAYANLGRVICFKKVNTLLEGSWNCSLLSYSKVLWLTLKA